MSDPFKKLEEAEREIIALISEAPSKEARLEIGRAWRRAIAVGREDFFKLLEEQGGEKVDWGKLAAELEATGRSDLVVRE